MEIFNISLQLFRGIGNAFNIRFMNVPLWFYFILINLGVILFRLELITDIQKDKLIFPFFFTSTNKLSTLILIPGMIIPFTIDIIISLRKEESK